MNIRIVDGRLTKDAEVKVSKEGKKFLSFSLANNEWVNGKEETIYFNVVSWDSHAILRQESNNFYKKGKLVIINGRPNENMTVKNGNTYLNRNIVADSIMLGTYSSNQTEQTNTVTYKDVVPVTVSVNQPTVTVEKPFTPICEVPKSANQPFALTVENPADDDDLPF